MITTKLRTIPQNFPNGVSAAFGTKHFDAVELEHPLISMDQVHGDSIVFVEDPQSKVVESSDGIITALDDLSLVVRTADCVPMLFYDEQTGLIGASHQGWKGTLMRLQQKMISEMVSRGAAVDSIHIAIGPCIGACCYKIFGDRFELFLKEFSPYQGEMFTTNNRETMLNLLYLNYELLLESGVKKDHIEYSLECTSCHETYFNSYNRDRQVTSMVSHIRKKSI